MQHLQSTREPSRSITGEAGREDSQRKQWLTSSRGRRKDRLGKLASGRLQSSTRGGQAPGEAAAWRNAVHVCAKSMSRSSVVRNEAMSAVVALVDLLHGEPQPLVQ